MAPINFKKGLLANLPSTYAEGTFYVTTDERAIYLDVADDKRIRLGDFQEFATLADLEANANPSTSALYYITDGNILAKWDGAKYVQINVQKTVEKSETNGNIKIDGVELVVYNDAALASRVTTAEGKITALETESAKHALKTDVEADLADKADKSYVGTFTHDTAKTVIEYINAKTDGIATSGNLEVLGQRVGVIESDYLRTADKTELEDKIDLKLDASDVTGDLLTHNASEFAAASHNHAISEVTGLQDALDNKLVAADIAELATKEEAQGYADAKDEAIAAAKKAGDDAQDTIDAYKTSNDTALAGVKATAEAAAVKIEVETALAGKADKVEGKSLISDSEITRLAGITNYDDTQVKADIAKKADAETVTAELGKKVDKVDGYSLVADTEIARLADVDNYDDTEVRSLIGDNADAIGALAGKVGEVGEGQTVMGIIKNIQENAYDDTEIRGLISDNTEAIEAINNAETGILKSAKDYADSIVKAEKERAEGIEGGLETRLAAVEGDYLKAADKEALQNQINTIMSNPDAEGAINSINEFTQYVKDHGTIAEGMRADINKNKEDIAAINNAETGILKQAKDHADGLAGNYAEAEHDHVVADITDFDSAVKAYGYATIDYTDGKASAAQSAAEATAAGALASAKSELEGKINAIDNHSHANKTVLDGISAEKVTAWDAAEQNAKDYVDTKLTWGTF